MHGKPIRKYIPNYIATDEQLNIARIKKDNSTSARKLIHMPDDVHFDIPLSKSGHWYATMSIPR